MNMCASYEGETKSLLSKFRMISKHQPVTDLSMFDVYCGDATEAEAPILSGNIQSLYINSCHLSSSFMRNVLQQLHDCVTLTNLVLVVMDLREVEEDLDKLLDNLVSNHEKGLSQKKLGISIEGLSEEFAAKWNERCEGITSIDCIIRYDDDYRYDDDDDDDDDDESESDSDTDNKVCACLC